VKVDNFALVFNKFPGSLKKELLENLRTQGNKFKLLKDLLDCYRKEEALRLTKALISELERSRAFKALTLKTTSRFAVGLGIPSFFENGLSFHHTYGVPYIPASSLKGLLRFAYLAEATGLLPLKAGIEKAFSINTEEPAEALAAVAKLDELLTSAKDYKSFRKAIESDGKLKEKLSIDEEKLQTFYDNFTRLFGTLHKKGELQLLDALPEEFELGIDLINPHFKEYYQSNEQERQRNATFLIGEWHNPVPIPFLVVEAASFKVFYKAPEEFKQRVSKLLRGALNMLGIGGKKGKGYGRLKFKNEGEE